MNKYDYENRVAIVTGGGQGIGLTVAERLRDSGASVSVWDRDQKLLDALAGTFHTVNVDIGKLESVEAGTKAVLDKFGKIDVLINNAAIVGPNANTWEYPPQAFMDVVHIGLVGTFFCCRTIVPHMIGAGYGRIVNLASVAGKEGNPGAPAYSSTKAGVIALTKSLGKELAKYNITVNAMCPGFVETDMVTALTDDVKKALLANIPLGRFGRPEEVANFVRFLVTEGDWITGQQFNPNGGQYM